MTPELQRPISPLAPPWRRDARRSPPAGLRRRRSGGRIPRIGGPHPQHHRSRPVGGPAPGQEALEGRGRDEGGIAIEDEDVARRFAASPSALPSASLAASTAWPVPSCSAWMALGWGATAALTASMPGATTTTTGAAPSGARLASTWPIIGRPAMGCSTFGRCDFIRVPLPAARTMAAVVDLAMIGFLLLLIPRSPSNRAANCHSGLPPPSWQIRARDRIQPVPCRLIVPSTSDTCDRTMAAPRSSLIFDLDGTLIDSAPDLAFALNALLAELDCAPLSLASGARADRRRRPHLGRSRAAGRRGHVRARDLLNPCSSAIARSISPMPRWIPGLCPGAGDARAPARAGLPDGGLHQ